MDINLSNPIIILVLLLSLETTQPLFSFSIYNLKLHKAVFNYTEVQSHKHSEKLVFEIEQALKKIGENYLSLTHLALNVGPGNFTGIRTGIAYASSLQLAFSDIDANFQVLPLNTFEILAHKAHKSNPALDKIATAVDAKKSEYYLQSFHCNYSNDGQGSNHDWLFYESSHPTILNKEEVENARNKFTIFEMKQQLDGASLFKNTISVDSKDVENLALSVIESGGRSLNILLKRPLQPLYIRDSVT